MGKNRRGIKGIGTNARVQMILRSITLSFAPRASF